MYHTFNQLTMVILNPRDTTQPFERRKRILEPDEHEISNHEQHSSRTEFMIDHGRTMLFTC